MSQEITQEIDESQFINSNVALPKVEDYKDKSEIEMIRERPETYTGSTDKFEREVILLTFSKDPESDKIITKCGKHIIFLPEAVERFFLEILSNAGDNAEKTRRTKDFKNKKGVIEINMNDRTITIRNGGVPIPIEQTTIRISSDNDKKVKSKTLWLPEKIFGYLRTSSNYDDDEYRTYCGKNGHGAKLANIFSNRFSVKIWNGLSGKYYEQVWTNGMRDVTEPIIKDYKKKECLVEVSYDLDLERFDYEKYPDNAYFLFAQHTANMSFVHKIPTTFNTFKFDCSNIRDYTRFLFGDDVLTNAVFHYEWPSGTKLVNRNGTKVSKNNNDKPVVEMCLLDTPDKGMHISFVNGMMTREGGVHVNAAYKAVTDYVLKAVAEKLNGKKGKGLNLTIKDVKEHATLIINATVIKPQFGGQTKTKLTKPNVNIKVSDKLQKKLLKWDLILRLKSAMEAKHFNKAKEKDGKREQYVDLKKCKDANWAGIKGKTKMCTALLTEGDSAVSYPNKWISFTEGGQNYMGTLPLGGKPLNALNANFLKASENKVFCRIKKFLGLREGVDYLDDDNYNTLRYGHIIILADADVDGSHITGLLLLYLYRYFKSLLQRGCINIVLTPVIRVTKGKEIIKFYTAKQYDDWKRETSNWNKYETKYYKGLGTSGDEEIMDEIQNPKIIGCFYDDQASESLNLAFNKKFSNQRKEWLSTIRKSLNIEKYKKIGITDIIHDKLKEYSLDNNIRSLPNFLDGLKPSQRKIIYTALYKQNLKGKSWTYDKIKNGSCKQMKVSQFGSIVSANTGYHHGENSLYEAIIKLTQNYIGSNNLNYFKPKSQFGSREKNGKDASSPRYIYMEPERWLYYVYRKEDESLYKYVIDDGEEQEPLYLLPIIPMHLINGSRGVGTAYSNFSPNHDVEDVCNWLLCKLTGEKTPDLFPKYRGFTGTIEIVEKKNKKSNNSDNNDKEEEEEDNTSDNDQAEKMLENILGIEGEEEVGEKENAVLGHVLGQELDGDGNLITDDQDEDYENDEEFIDKNTKYSMIVKGSFQQLDGKIIIDEIPIGKSIDSAREYYEKLAREKVIKDFKNMSKHYKPEFHLKGFKNPSLKKLKLIKSFGLGCMTFNDMSHIPHVFKNVYQLIETYYQHRLYYYGIRKNNILASIRKKIELDNLKIRFITEVAVNKTIKVMNETKKSVYNQMEKFDLPGYVYDKTTVPNLSVDEINKLKKEVEAKEKEYSILDSTTNEELWLQDLKEFMKIYEKYYKYDESYKIDIKKPAK